MMEKQKSIYEKPEAFIVRLTLFTPIAQRPPGGGGGIGEWDEFNPTTNGGTQLGRETGGSFFDDEEFGDDGLLNGGPNMFSDWEDKDKL